MEFESPYKTEALGHLGLVAGTIEKLGLIDKINARLPLDKRKGGKVSHGHRAAAMILNGLGYLTRTLYLSPHFFEDKPLDILLGEQWTADDFNDDMLGRHLDRIAAYGSTQLFSEIVCEVASEQGLFNKSYHLDSTTFTLYGDYDVSELAQPLPTYGYSKDHRPDLKQVTLSLTQVGEANLPIWFEALDGNSSDKASFQETVKQIKKFQQHIKEAPDNIPFVVDAAFYTPEKLKVLSNVTWITRVPTNFKAAKACLGLADDAVEWEVINKHYKIHTIETCHHDMPQRWVLVDTKKGRQRAMKTFYKQLDKAYEAHAKTVWHLSNQTFACEKDAEKAIGAFIKKLKFHCVDYTIEPIMKFEGKGRPKKGTEPLCVGYAINAAIASDLNKINQAIMRAGRFLLATNELDRHNISNADVLLEYKQQTHVEGGFRFMKSDEFELNHIFLKTPERIGALMMIMTLCLVVYNFAQYQMRKTLEHQDTVLPNQLGKPVKNPTLRWIFQLLSHISVICVWDDQTQSWHKKIANLKKIHHIILYHFGSNTLKRYGLPIDMALPVYDKNQKTLQKWCGM